MTYDFSDLRLFRNELFLMAVVLSAILVPFVVFHEHIDAWTNAFLGASGNHPAWTAMVMFVLLTSDILLPVPSSIISAGAGYLLGFVPGALVSFVGMTAGCLLGYELGSGSSGLVQRFDKNSSERMKRFFGRSGMWALVLARPVPVLAEASVFFAGLSRMNRLNFVVVSSLSNLGISMVYAAVGVYSVSFNSFLLAFGGAIAIPALAKVVEVVVRRGE
ncbi:MAG: VTT domain-containing protein [Saprospiraceae bacterium]|nr:VTT domain-containing protein [Saprospiraceae bacterium]